MVHAADSVAKQHSHDQTPQQIFSIQLGSSLPAWKLVVTGRPHSSRGLEAARRQHEYSPWGYIIRARVKEAKSLWIGRGTRQQQMLDFAISTGLTSNADHYSIRAGDERHSSSRASFLAGKDNDKHDISYAGHERNHL